MKLKDLTGLKPNPEIEILDQNKTYQFSDELETRDVVVRSGDTIIGRRSIVQRKVKK